MKQFTPQTPQHKTTRRPLDLTAMAVQRKETGRQGGSNESCVHHNAGAICAKVVSFANMSIWQVDSRD